MCCSTSSAMAQACSVTGQTWASTLEVCVDQVHIHARSKFWHTFDKLTSLCSGCQRNQLDVKKAILTDASEVRNICLNPQIERSWTSQFNFMQKTSKFAPLRDKPGSLSDGPSVLRYGASVSFEFGSLLRSGAHPYQIEFSGAVKVAHYGQVGFVERVMQSRINMLRWVTCFPISHCGTSSRKDCLS